MAFISILIYITVTVFTLLAMKMYLVQGNLAKTCFILNYLSTFNIPICAWIGSNGNILPIITLFVPSRYFQKCNMFNFCLRCISMELRSSSPSIEKWIHSPRPLVTNLHCVPVTHRALPTSVFSPAKTDVELIQCKLRRMKNKFFSDGFNINFRQDKSHKIDKVLHHSGFLFIPI